jgi:D-alanyl-D-alanine carboxypeptidase
MSINARVLLQHRPLRPVVAVAALLAATLVVPASAGVAVPGAPGGSVAATRAGSAGIVPGGSASPEGPPEGRLAGAVAVGGTASGAGQAGGVVTEPRVLARAAILADEATGQVLFERNPRSPRAMASTTKVMTALLALERLDERRVVVIGARPPRIGEESLRLRQGERLTVRQLLLGLLVKSANDAGVALAEAVDGSEGPFVRRMNRRAAALRLATTHYVTPYGLDRPGHQTSARDLARLWEVAMRRADFRAIVRTSKARLPGGPLSLRRFVTSNQLLGAYRWTVGGKTGFTNRAGRCLVASASRGGRRLVAVALGSPNAFADVRAMFEYGFSKLVRVRLAGRGQPVSLRPGRPSAHQVDADTDALVRLDQLDTVQLEVREEPVGTAGTGSGTATGPGAGAAVTAWLVSGQRRLVQVPLVRLPAAGPPPSSTRLPPAPATGPAATIPGATIGPAGTVGGAGAGDPLGATLTAGAAVRVWPVPRGAAVPTIDPFLRRDPP